MTGASTLASLGVTNNATVGGTLGIGKPASLTYALDVSGTVNLNKGLTVLANGMVAIVGATTCALDVSGLAIFSSNVGIGLTNPSYALEVKGDVGVTGLLLQNGTPYVGSQWTTSNGGIWYGGAIGVGSNMAVAFPGPARVALDVSGATVTNPIYLDTWSGVAAFGYSNAGLTGTARALPNYGLACVPTGGFAGATVASVNVCGSNQVNLVSGGGAGSTAPAFNLVVGYNSVVTVTGDGRVGIGTTAPAAALHVVGQALVTGDIAAFYSDDRLKTRIGDIDGALNIINSLSAFRYAPNDVALGYGFRNKVGLGLSAQEVKAVLPEIVTGAPFDAAPNETSASGQNYLTVQYERMVPVLVQAVRELTHRLRALEDKMNGTFF